MSGNRTVDIGMSARRKAFLKSRNVESSSFFALIQWEEDRTTSIVKRQMILKRKVDVLAEPTLLESADILEPGLKVLAKLPAPFNGEFWGEILSVSEDQRKLKKIERHFNETGKILVITENNKKRKQNETDDTTSQLQKILQENQEMLKEILEQITRLENNNQLESFRGQVDTNTSFSPRATGNEINESGLSDDTIEANDSINNLLNNSSVFQSLNQSDLIDLQAESISRSNFATNIMRRIFKKNEMLNHNVRGVKGKNPLSPKRLSYIQEQTFIRYPLQNGETESKAWKECRIVLDATLRKIKE